MAVLVVKENNNIEQAIRRVFEYFDLTHDLYKGVFLKPNIVFPVGPKSGEITRHEVVRAVVNELRRLDPQVDIVMGESPAAGTEAKRNFKISKYDKLADKLKIPLLDLNEVEYDKINWKYGTLELPQIAMRRIYINLPILKASSAATISGAMKNQKGLLLPEIKKRFHQWDLHEPIAHLNKMIQPILTIADGINFFKDNIIIAGDNTYEVDCTAIRILQAPEPGYIKFARNIDVGKDNFITQGLDQVDIKSKYQSQVNDYKQYLRIRVWSNHRACSMCRYAFLRIRKNPWEDIKYTLLMYSRLLRYAMAGADIIFGSNPIYEPRFRNIICVGKCTKKLAREKGYIYIPGCPPTKEQMLKYFR